MKNKNKQILITLLLALALPLLVIAAMQIQELRKQAAGTNEVMVQLSPASGNFSSGETVTIKTTLSNTAQRAINISGAQAVLSVDSKFTINSATCLSPFNGLPFTKISGTTVTVMCAIGTGSTPIAVTSAELPFAQLSLTVTGSAVDGAASIAFTSTRATEAGIGGQAPDVSKGGDAGNFTIGSGGTVNPSQPVNANVILFFSPAQLNLPPAANVKIMANALADNVAFTRTVITFDKNKVNLASEITTNPAFSTIVEKTSMATANTQGKAVIVVATGPIDSKPTGSFELASFSITPAGSQVTGNTTLDFWVADMQYVNSSGKNLGIGTTALNISLNNQNTTPPIGGEFEIPIGSKDEITINIGDASGGNNPQITFSAALAHTANNPDMYFRLRVKDELYFVDNPNANLNPSCNTAGEGEKDFHIPMSAVNGVYRPVPSINIPPPSGVTAANVTPDGWIILSGISPNRYNNFVLKAPKFRASKTAEHILLQTGQNTAHNFSWENNPLEPGDLPNPNSGDQQDCTVNSIDLSLIVNRIGSTVQSDLNVGDVNFDGIVNGNDVAKVVNTLSTKPDDDL